MKMALLLENANFLVLAYIGGQKEVFDMWYSKNEE